MTEKKRKAKQEFRNIPPRNRAKNVTLTLAITGAILLVGVFLFLKSDTAPVFDTEKTPTGSVLSIQVPENINAPSLTLFVDNREFTLPTKKKVASRNIDPGPHRIILVAPDRWPWIKNISVSKDQTIRLDPFLVDKTPESNVYKILREPKTYQDLKTSLTKENKKTTATSSDESVVLDFSDRSIIAKWIGEEPSPVFFCGGKNASSTEKNASTTTQKKQDASCPSSTVVFSGTRILDADFYGKRNDVIVFGTPGGVHVIEITARSPQNFHPVYEGPLSAMAFLDGSVYLQDKGASGVIIEIPLSSPISTETASSSLPQKSTSTKE